jgi:hypothetical protein
MDSDDLDDLMDDPRFVSGIYNYCDAWCDRCPFTERCINFAMGERMKEEAERRRSDADNAAFWDRLDAKSQEPAEPADSSPEAEEDEEWDEAEFQEYCAREERKHKEAQSRPCARAAWRYTNMVDAWWKAHEAELEAALKPLSAEPPAGPAAPDPAEDAIQLQDATEVIGWYQHQMWVKLMRALHEDDDIKELAEELDFPKDSDGSAKVALIGMDRSLAAWADVARLLPAWAESVQPMFDLLVRLRHLVEGEFPDARAFVRAGFDAPLPVPGEEAEDEE